jgi:hypothetical protein
MFLLFLFFAVLGLEFRASCLLGKLSTIWAIFPAHFALVILEIGSPIYAWADLDHILLMYTSCPRWDEGMIHHAQIFLLTWNLMNFFAGLTLSHNPPSFCLLSSYDSKCELYAWAKLIILILWKYFNGSSYYSVL